MGVKNLFSVPNTSFYSASNADVFSNQLKTINTGSVFFVEPDYSSSYYQYSNAATTTLMTSSYLVNTLSSTYYDFSISTATEVTFMSYLIPQAGGTNIISITKYAYKMRGYNTLTNEHEYWTTTLPPGLPSASYINVTVESTWRTS